VTPPRSAAFFDLDKTIIAKSSSLAFSRPFYKGGLINRRAVLRSGFAQFVFLVGGADHDQMERMRAYLQSLVTGWPVDQVDAIVHETLHELIDPIVFDEAVTLMEEHHAAGRDVVIVSSSGSAVVEPIGAMLGADHVLATRMVVEAGAYTGEIDFYAYGDNKAVAVTELAEAKGYDLAASFAYSDSVTDVPMLQAVGHPFAVNADRGLRKVAEESGWEQLTFATPVEMRRRLPRVAEIPPKQRLAAGAVAAGAAAGAAAGIVWFASRRSQPTA